MIKVDGKNSVYAVRKLGKGQSVVFYIPEEIKVEILSLTEKHKESNIEKSDVLRWAVSKTWIDLRRSIPLWAVQGERFAYQSQLWRDIGRDDAVTISVDQAQAFLEPESEPLEHRYRPHQKDTPFLSSRLGKDEFDNLIRARCRELDDLDFTSSQLQEE
jgi:hypothetical protein